MGGLILDNVIAFLYGALRRWMDDRRSRDWPLSQAELLRATVPRSMYPHILVQYAYRANGSDFTGSFRKSYWYSSSAEQAAQRLSQIQVVQVRYKAGEVACSVLREADQLAHVMPER